MEIESHSGEADRTVPRHEHIRLVGGRAFGDIHPTWRQMQHRWTSSAPGRAELAEPEPIEMDAEHVCPDVLFSSEKAGYRTHPQTACFLSNDTPTMRRTLGERLCQGALRRGQQRSRRKPRGT